MFCAALEAVSKSSQADAYAPPQDARFTYGTAGFRMKCVYLESRIRIFSCASFMLTVCTHSASLLPPVMFRVGLVAVLRSMRFRGQAVGVMITASHNPEHDNGVKIVDPMGDMLEAAWEAHATAITNAQGPEQLQNALSDLAAAGKVDLSASAKVVYAYDTRPSCPGLVAALEAAFQACQSAFGQHTIKLVNAGLQTTPILHYLVRTHNDPSYGQPTEQAYYAKLAKAFKTLTASAPPLKGVLSVDGANGVGAPKAKAFIETLGPDAGLNMQVTHDATTTPGALNSKCGADFVKTQQKAPPAVTLSPASSPSSPDDPRFSSFDGDADRLIYYYANNQGEFKLLDGDKIATLCASFLINLLQTAGLADSLKLGVVQTAYANGSSSSYIAKNLQVPVTVTPTGVKHLHHAAQAKYDIGVYFEANGHGTIVFSPTALEAFEKHSPSSPVQDRALGQLRACADLINQTVGDALSDMLFVEAILRHKAWSCAEWDSSYTDLPNRLVKCSVKDRTLFETTDAERRLTKPEGLQAQIDELVAKYPQGRSFVRPSGTEDCVRVYAEAATRSDTEGMRCLAVVVCCTALILLRARPRFQGRHPRRVQLWLNAWPKSLLTSKIPSHFDTLVPLCFIYARFSV